MIPAETILFFVAGYRGYRYAQPTAKHGLSPCGDRLLIAGLVLRATFQSPLQLRGEAQSVINCGLYSQGMGTGCYKWRFIQAGRGTVCD